MQSRRKKSSCNVLESVAFCSESIIHILYAQALTQEWAEYPNASEETWIWCSRRRVPRKSVNRERRVSLCLAFARVRVRVHKAHQDSLVPNFGRLPGGRSRAGKKSRSDCHLSGLAPRYTYSRPLFSRARQIDTYLTRCSAMMPALCGSKGDLIFPGARAWRSFAPCFCGQRGFLLRASAKCIVSVAYMHLYMWSGRWSFRDI